LIPDTAPGITCTTAASKALLSLAAIIGLQVLSSNETPGLGDKIEKDPDFRANFTALDASLKQEIVTVKNGEKTEPWQIDGISGATVSSKAVGKALNESAQFWIPTLKQALSAGGTP
jgi:electron transport complex protein RnfG